MKKSKVFLVITAIFMAIIIYVAYDIASRTSFPMGRPGAETDSTKSVNDSVKLKNPMEIEIRRKKE